MQRICSTIFLTSFPKHFHTIIFVTIRCSLLIRSKVSENVTHGRRIVHSYHTSGLSLDRLWGPPGLVDELHRHLGELGEILLDIVSIRVHSTSANMYIVYLIIVPSEPYGINNMYHKNQLDEESVIRNSKCLRMLFI